jgi:anthranilate phosphoribosyltransferase
VCINAAAAIVAGGKAADIGEGWKLANASLDSGAALRALESLIACARAG